MSGHKHDIIFPNLEPPVISLSHGKIVATLQDGSTFIQSLFETACLYKRYFSPQAYSTRMEDTLRRLFQLTRVSASEDCGDAYSQVLGSVEVKVSISDKSLWSIQQIRTWQEISHYLLFYCAIDDPTMFLGFVPGSLIKQAAHDIGGNSHKVTGANDGKFIERGICFAKTTKTDSAKHKYRQYFEQYNILNEC